MTVNHDPLTDGAAPSVTNGAEGQQLAMLAIPPEIVHLLLNRLYREHSELRGLIVALENLPPLKKVG